MPRHFIASAAALLQVLLSTACGVTEPQGISCTREFRYGVTAAVTDAADGTQATEGLSGVLTEGSYREEMEVGGNVLVGAGERAGLYELTIMADGYVAWTESALEVTADKCHVDPVSLEVLLHRSVQPGP
ncbi:MAG: hypothetical protein ACKVIN_13650 [Longimicrobiales bacterium]|jgi:hypothetical protein